MASGVMSGCEEESRKKSQLIQLIMIVSFHNFNNRFYAGIYRCEILYLPTRLLRYMYFALTSASI